MEYQNFKNFIEVNADTTYFRYVYISVLMLLYNLLYSRSMTQLVHVYFTVFKYFCPLRVYYLITLSFVYLGKYFGRNERK